MDVLDSALPAPLFEELRAHVEGKHYRFGWTSGDRSEFDRFFNSQYLACATRNRRDVSAELEAQAPGPLWQAWYHLREQHFARTPVLLRAYCNMQLFGVESHPHTDVPPWHVDDRSSVLYCVDDAWQGDWGGATVVFERDGRLHGVLPAPNRLVTLPSAQMHQAQPLARHCPVPRFVLVFKFRPPCERHDFFERKNWDRTLVGGRWLSERFWGAGWQARQMGAPAHVAEAAMFHLAYLQGLLGGAAPATREELLALISPEAEALVHAISRLPVDRLDESLTSEGGVFALIQAARAADLRQYPDKT